MKKLLICLLTLTVICIFTGCTSAKNDSEIIGGADGKTSIIVTDNKDIAETGKPLNQSEENKTVPVVSITEDEAKNTAFEDLKKKCKDGYYNDIENFEFTDISILEHDESCIAYNSGYGDSAETENFSGHAYYCVEYKITNQLCDFVYYCIDAQTGDLLFSGYMGD